MHASFVLRLPPPVTVRLFQQCYRARIHPAHQALSLIKACRFIEEIKRCILHYDFQEWRPIRCTVLDIEQHHHAFASSKAFDPREAGCNIRFSGAPSHRLTRFMSRHGYITRSEP
jgi:hypothetical protein